MGRDKEYVGWREWIGLPDLGVRRIKAKVDTGARSSSLHAFDLELVTQGRTTLVRFKVHPFQDDSQRTIQCEAPLHDQRFVKSSSGHRQMRPVIRPMLSFDGDQWPIDLTLTARDLMGFRMLLGREALRGRFVVDPGRSFLKKALVPKERKRQT
jgi:hypothetical protein